MGPETTLATVNGYHIALLLLGYAAWRWATSGGKEGEPKVTPAKRRPRRDRTSRRGRNQNAPRP